MNEVNGIQARYELLVPVKVKECSTAKDGQLVGYTPREINFLATATCCYGAMVLSSVVEEVNVFGVKVAKYLRKETVPKDSILVSTTCRYLVQVTTDNVEALEKFERIASNFEHKGIVLRHKSGVEQVLDERIWEKQKVAQNADYAKLRQEVDFNKNSFNYADIDDERNESMNGTGFKENLYEQRRLYPLPTGDVFSCSLGELEIKR